MTMHLFTYTLGHPNVDSAETARRREQLSWLVAERREARGRRGWGRIRGARETLSASQPRRSDDPTWRPESRNSRRGLR